MALLFGVLFDKPGLAAFGVEDCLGGCEGLRVDEEKGGLDIETLDGSGEVDGVHVCEETDDSAEGVGLVIWVVAQRLIHKLNREVASTNANYNKVDH
jgi:hypothetical protein